MKIKVGQSEARLFGRAGESVTRSDRRERELEFESPFPPLTARPNRRRDGTWELTIQSSPLGGAPNQHETGGKTCRGASKRRQPCQQKETVCSWQKETARAKGDSCRCPAVGYLDADRLHVEPGSAGTQPDRLLEACEQRVGLGLPGPACPCRFKLQSEKSQGVWGTASPSHAVVFRRIPGVSFC